MKMGLRGMARWLMMPVIAALSAIALTVTLTGCGSGDGSQAVASPQHESAVVPVRSWALLYTASCSAGAAPSCVGAYGFTLWNDGRYEVGPGPQGQLVRGWVQRSDIDGLSAHLADLRLDGVSADFVSSSPLNRCAAPAVGQTAAEVRLLSGQRSRVLLSDSGTAFCADRLIVPSTSDAQDLESWIRGIAQKYSPPSFPNPCVDAANALEEKYSQIRSCHSDADCAYVDENLLPIESSIATRVVSDDCSYIQPLTVANPFLAVTHQRELLLERELARKVCGSSLMKTQCTHPYSFDPAAGAPICQQGECIINPSAEKGL